MINLKDKKIVVTGATGGIGNSIIEKFHTNGAKILGTGTNEQKLQTLKDKYHNLNILKFDINDHSKIEQFSKL